MSAANENTADGAAEGTSTTTVSAPPADGPAGDGTTSASEAPETHPSNESGASQAEDAGDPDADAPQTADEADGVETSDDQQDDVPRNESPSDEGTEETGETRETEDPEESDDEAPAWNDTRVRAALEAMLFAADEPLSVKVILQSIPDAREETVRRALGQMMLELSGDARGIHLAEVAGGYQLRTNATYNEQVLRLFEAKPTKLSRAAMETLAIVAYRQPVTKAIVDEIRGVDCGGVLRGLTDVELIAVIGKADDIGRPNLYGTTQRFLEFFGLASLTDLPTLEDFEVDALELLGEDVEQLLGEREDDDEDDDEREPAHAGGPRFSDEPERPPHHRSGDARTREAAETTEEASRHQPESEPDAPESDASESESTGPRATDPPHDDAPLTEASDPHDDTPPTEASDRDEPDAGSGNELPPFPTGRSATAHERPDTDDVREDDDG